MMPNYDSKPSFFPCAVFILAACSEALQAEARQEFLNMLVSNVRGFVILLQDPGRFRKVRETCRNNPALTSCQNSLMISSCNQHGERFTSMTFTCIEGVAYIGVAT